MKTYLDGRVTLHGGDNRDVLRTFPDASIDSIVTDPPYALVSIVKRFGKAGAAAAKPEGMGGAYNRLGGGFMGKAWDTGEVAFAVEFWAECLRVLKPGGHVVAFSGTRTYHRMAVAIEDAGFEIRDQIGWAYGSGFPKSHDVSKAIDKAAGAEREIIGPRARPDGSFRDATKGSARGVSFAGSVDGSLNVNGAMADVTAPATDAARQWSGYGTALKPAWEPICLARKPLIGTVADNVLTHGTGALNIAACRIAGEGNKTFSREAGNRDREQYRTGTTTGAAIPSDLGRFPANFIHDGSDEVVALFPETGPSSDKPMHHGDFKSVAKGYERAHTTFGHADCGGSAARFFYTAKADSHDRLGSKHPTVKPIDLMQYLVRLVTPKRVLSCPKCDTLRNAQNSEKKASSETPMCVVFGGVQAEGQPAYGPLLQPPMCGGRQGIEAEAVRLVRDDVPAPQGRGAALLQPVMRGEVDRKKQENVEGICHQQGGISAAMDAGPSPVSQPEGLHFRTPLGGAADDWQATRKERGRAPQKRNKGRQSPGEPRSNEEGGSRQDQSSEAEHALLPPLSGQDRDQPSCPHCGHQLEWRPGVCLDPFAGTGTTGEAAWREGMTAILIERETEYQDDIARRMDLATNPTKRSAVAATKNNIDDLGPLFGGK